MARHNNARRSCIPDVGTKRYCSRKRIKRGYAAACQTSARDYPRAFAVDPTASLAAAVTKARPDLKAEPIRLRGR
jgi:hypothetical protein